MMLSEEYRDRWAAITIRSQRRARDWMQELDNARMLLTPEREKEIQLGVLSAMAERFQQIQPFELLDQVYGRGHTGTPDDMYKAINEWMTQFIQAIRHS